MNKVSKRYKVVIITFVAVSFLLQGCFLFRRKGAESLTDRLDFSGGEIVSYYDTRPYDAQYIPANMVVVPNGTFHMGQADEDVPST
ncbi:MAG: gliding motility protein, partial [Bacteroidota bacterium]